MGEILQQGIIYPCEIIHCRSEVMDLSSGRCTDRACSRNNWQLVIPKVAGRQRTQSRWDQPGLWQMVDIWLMKSTVVPLRTKGGKRGARKIHELRRRRSASKVSRCPAEYKPRLEATVRFEALFMPVDGKQGKVSLFLQWKGERGQPWETRLEIFLPKPSANFH